MGQGMKSLPWPECRGCVRDRWKRKVRLEREQGPGREGLRGPEAVSFILWALGDPLKMFSRYVSGQKTDWKTKREVGRIVRRLLQDLEVQTKALSEGWKGEQIFPR